MVSPEISVLEQSPWLRAADGGFARLLLAASRPVTVKRGKLIYEVGDPTEGLYGVVEGMVAFRLDISHAEVITGHAFGPGTWFGEGAFLTGQQRHLTVAALSDCTLAHVAPSDLRAMCDSDPSTWRWLARLSALNTVAAAIVARNLLVTDPRQRVMAVLSTLSRTGAGTRALPITQTDLAEMCALSRSAVSRILGELEVSGFCRRRYGRIEMLTHTTPNSPVQELSFEVGGGEKSVDSRRQV